MSQHTKGPWVKASHATPTRTGFQWEVGVLSDSSPDYLRTFALVVGKDAEANAARIVACVNACEGIEDPNIVPEMLEALRACKLAISSGIDSNPELWAKATRMTASVIARAEGGRK